MSIDAETMADVLDCFWNAGIGSATESQDITAMAVAGALAEGFSAMARRLRETAPKPLKYAQDEAVIDAVQRLFEKGRVTLDPEGYMVAYPYPRKPVIAWQVTWSNGRKIVLTEPDAKDWLTVTPLVAA